MNKLEESLPKTETSTPAELFKKIDKDSLVHLATQQHENPQDKDYWSQQTVTLGLLGDGNVVKERIFLGGGPEDEKEYNIVDKARALELLTYEIENNPSNTQAKELKIKILKKSQ